MVGGTQIRYGRQMEYLTDSQTTALRWGVWDAIDQYRNATNANRPKVVRITDQEVLRAVDAGAIGADTMERFLREYEVFRFPLNVSSDRNLRLRDIANIIEQNYRLKNTSEQLPSLWWGAVEDVRDRLALEFAGRQFHMRSMCMKLLWFYRPSRATMWDSYVVQGVNAWRNLNLRVDISQKDEASEFLAAFDLTFDHCTEFIGQLLASVRTLGSGMDYPFPRRVLDKALWFIGANADERSVLLDRLRGDPERWSWFEANG